MPTKIPAKTREQKLQERWQEIDVMRQMQARHEAERAEREREQNEFAQRVQAYHEAVDTHIRRSWAQREDRPMTEHEMNMARAEIEQAAFAQFKVEIKPLGQLYAEQAEAERLAAEEAERQRIANLSPKDIWLSTLSWQERQRVAKWEGINKMPYPYAPV